MTAVAHDLRAVLRTSAFRLSAVYVAAFVLAAALIVGALFLQMNAQLARRSLDIVAAEAEGLEGLVRGGDIAPLVEAIRERSRGPGTGLYLLADGQGRKLAGNLNRWPPELSLDPPGGLFRYEAAGSSDPDRIAIGVPTMLAGDLRLLVGRDLEEQRAFIERVKWLFLWGIGLFSLAGLAGGLMASRRLLQRVDEINRVGRSIIAGDLTRRVAATGDDELADLARNLNAMLERIEQLMAGLREVSDNIAHDLKTPLTRLRNQAEAALRDGAMPGTHKAGLERVIEEADELIKTFNALLLIARLEAGAVEGSLDDVDLGQVVAGAAELYEPLAEEHGVTIACSAPAGIRIKANRQLVGQAVVNLIDNAIKYAGPGRPASIDVRLGPGTDGPEVVVADHGVGIRPEDRERVMKRFVRLEASRTRPGTGLGLSLVAAVARLHGGTVRLEDNNPGLRVVLALPARA